MQWNVLHDECNYLVTMLVHIGDDIPWVTVPMQRPYIIWSKVVHKSDKIVPLAVYSENALSPLREVSHAMHM